MDGTGQVVVSSSLIEVSEESEATRVLQTQLIGKQTRKYGRFILVQKKNHNILLHKTVNIASRHIFTVARCGKLFRYSSREPSI